MSGRRKTPSACPAAWVCAALTAQPGGTAVLRAPRRGHRAGGTPACQGLRRPGAPPPSCPPSSGAPFPGVSQGGPSRRKGKRGSGCAPLSLLGEARRVLLTATPAGRPQAAGLPADPRLLFPSQSVSVRRENEATESSHTMCLSRACARGPRRAAPAGASRWRFPAVPEAVCPAGAAALAGGPDPPVGGAVHPSDGGGDRRRWWGSASGASGERQQLMCAPFLLTQHPARVRRPAPPF